ncbi:hypothetical protein EZS27_042889, partial [termite gut metagenome]
MEDYSVALQILLIKTIYNNSLTKD